MAKQPLRIRIPIASFQSHDESFKLEEAPLTLQQSHDAFDLSAGGSLTLPEPRTVRTVVLRQDEKGDFYLEMEE